MFEWLKENTYTIYDELPELGFLDDDDGEDSDGIEPKLVVITAYGCVWKL